MLPFPPKRCFSYEIPAVSFLDQGTIADGVRFLQPLLLHCCTAQTQLCCFYSLYFILEARPGLKALDGWQGMWTEPLGTQGWQTWPHVGDWQTPHPAPTELLLGTSSDSSFNPTSSWSAVTSFSPSCTLTGSQSVLQDTSCQAAWNTLKETAQISPQMWQQKNRKRKEFPWIFCQVYLVRIYVRELVLIMSLVKRENCFVKGTSSTSFL